MLLLQVRFCEQVVPMCPFRPPQTPSAGLLLRDIRRSISPGNEGPGNVAETIMGYSGAPLGNALRLSAVSPRFPSTAVGTRSAASFPKRSLVSRAGASVLRGALGT